MFNSLKIVTLAAGVSIFALTSMAVAQEMPRASEIEVTASFDAAEDTNAETMFPEITSDIQLAIAELVPQSSDGADPIINVDIRKIALDGDTIIPDSAEFNQLEGVVSINTETGNNGQSFPVNITAISGGGEAPEGYILIAPTTDDFYTAMVEAFAQNVAEQFLQINLEGGRIEQ